ncbi:MAG: Diaminopimelate epimerase [Eubacteriales bacterium SKADARSKE-1]|nr:Diaminopimelate epimerase [Eubacteriales bacterium SKADARSKE-1]
MKLKFTKMHGCGNDYIYFDCINNGEIKDPGKLSVTLSDRRFGIGGDGIILICPSKIADAKMRMFNMDSSEGKMCGNGIRCVGKYLFDNKIIDKNVIRIETLSGIKTLKIKEKNQKAELITVDMGKAIFDPKEIPVNINKDKIINYPIKKGNTEYHINCVSMGNPHCVVFCEDVNNINIEKIGPFFENFEAFPEKINTEFIKVIDDKTLLMRVWERGSGETFACGTGACAAVVMAVESGYCKKNEDITVKLKGGDLLIKYTDDAVYMTGGATKVFEGIIEV